MVISELWLWDKVSIEQSNGMLLCSSARHPLDRLRVFYWASVKKR